MKACLKLATLAMVLIAPAGAYAADPVAGPIGSHQEAQQDPQQEPQRIPDPVEFFDKTTGKVKVWYWRAESGYEFYDAPGFHPRTGVALTAVTLDVITEWEQSQKNATRCYIIQRDPRAPVIYRDHLPGMDPETGRECRLVTISLVERLNEYANGKKPGKIKSTQPEFFDPRTSEPIVWYADHGGTIEIFDLLGYDPETGDELLAVTPEIVDRWKAQVARKPPYRVDPNSHPFFDPKTGRPNIWHSPGENDALEFFDGPGFHPKTGKALTEITQDFAEKLRREKADDLEREKQKRAEQEALKKQEEDRKQQEEERKRQDAMRKRPTPVDPDTHPFFDLKTGRPNIGIRQGRTASSNSLTAPAFTRKRARLSQRSRKTLPRSYQTTNKSEMRRKRVNDRRKRVKYRRKSVNDRRSSPATSLRGTPMTSTGAARVSRTIS